jgi:sarcosine oxidase
MSAEVIVVGLGSMGAAAVRELAARGVRVLGLDRFTPPHERGAHGGGSRIIRMAYMEGPVYVPLVRRAYQLWRELEERTGTSLLRPTGGLMLGRPESVAFGGALATARAQRLPHDLLDPGEIRLRFPTFRPADDEMGLYEEVAGLIRPEAAITALLDEARQLGADLRPGVPVLDWQAGGDGVTVRTAGGELHAERLILAPGAWAADLVRLAVPLRVERRVQHFWRPVDPAAFEPGRFPIWIWGYEPGRAAYGLPATDAWVKAAMHHGGKVFGGAVDNREVVGGEDAGGEVVDPDIGAAPARPEEVDAMRRWLADRIPGLGEWLGAKPCLYTLTPDEHFVLGAHPDAANVAVACGFSGHGFKFVPVVGEILADLAMGRPVGHDLSPFDPGRFSAAPMLLRSAHDPLRN